MRAVWVGIWLLVWLAACDSGIRPYEQADAQSADAGAGQPVPIPDAAAEERRRTSDAGDPDVSGGGCVAETEVCNGVDDDCDDAVDEDDVCEHTVRCRVSESGGVSASDPSDAFFSPGADQACRPGGSSGICAQYFGDCVALASSDGHTHAVRLHLFDNGYQDMAGPFTRVRIAGTNSICSNSGVCRRWFGRAVALEANGHTHQVECTLFSDGYQQETAASDAIYFNAAPANHTANQTLCRPSGDPEAFPDGTCRRWFGRCRTVGTSFVSP